MSQDRSRDLQWWHLPKWAPAASRILVTKPAVGLVFGLAVGLVFGLRAGLLAGLVIGGYVAIAVVVLSGDTRQGIRGPRLRQAPSRANLARGFLAGLWDMLWVRFGFGFLVGVAVGLVYGPVVGVVVGVAVGLAAGAVEFLAKRFELLAKSADVHEDADSTSSLSPLTSWRTARNDALVQGLVFGLRWGLWAGLAIGGYVVYRAGTRVRPSAVTEAWLRVHFPDGLRAGLVVAVVVGVAVGLAYALSGSAWSSSLASALLARSWQTPVRLMRFLDDARERGVLRTVGPVYQFRHALLQDRLAEQDNSPP